MPSCRTPFPARAFPYRRFTGFLSDSSPLMRDLRFLYRGHAFSTTAGEMSAGKPHGGSGKLNEKWVVKTELGEEKITDTKILHNLAKYLWLQDNLEFRFRIVMELGLLIGVKDQVKTMNPKRASAIESLEQGNPGSDANFGMQQCPDGDIEIDEKFWEEEFNIPNCQQCGGMLKPDWASAIESLEQGNPGSDANFGMQQRPDGDIEIDAKFFEEEFNIPNCQQCGGMLKPDFRGFVLSPGC